MDTCLHSHMHMYTLVSPSLLVLDTFTTILLLPGHILAKGARESRVRGSMERREVLLRYRFSSRLIGASWVICLPLVPLSVKCGIWNRRSIKVPSSSETLCTLRCLCRYCSLKNIQTTALGSCESFQKREIMYRVWSHCIFCLVDLHMFSFFPLQLIVRTFFQSLNWLEHSHYESLYYIDKAVEGWASNKRKGGRKGGRKKRGKKERELLYY